MTERKPQSMTRIKDLAWKKACVLTHGCPESRIDSARVREFLRDNGYIITNKVEDADLILFRTCGLTKQSENTSLEAIRKIKSHKKKNACFIAWGCLPKINLTALRQEYEGITFDENGVKTLDEIVQAKRSIRETNANYLMPRYEQLSTFRKIIGLPLWALRARSILPFDQSIDPIPFHYKKRFDPCFYIRVSTGCLGKCTFCVLRISRGTVRSKSIEEILSEFKGGLMGGYKDFCLLGTDLGAYGRDKGYTLIDLLGKIMAEEQGNYSISLRNVNPHWLTRMYDGIGPILSSGKIKFLSSSLESGSDRILGLMGREYSVKEYMTIIQDVKRKYPSILLSTQIMVGFPTETKQDFQRSVKIIKEALFDEVEVYKYSPRTGTPAATMVDQIPEYVKEYRELELLLISAVSMRITRYRSTKHLMELSFDRLS